MKKIHNLTWLIYFMLLSSSISGQYQAYINPESRSLNITSMVVGSTTGNFDVNNFGEATYSIPVFCSPGTKGMIPNIKILYNSNNKGGLLGAGWDIAGLSVIQRVQKNYYHENAVDGVDLQSTDRFALDGNRLILVNGTYGSNLSEYRTEIESYHKITANGVAGTGPSWFKVETKEGFTLEYGNTADSKVEAYGSSTVYQWRINKITDTFGNYMKFTYYEINGESYINSIDYTGFSTTQQPYNSLKFVYAQRTDKNFKYVGGYKVPDTKILSEISMESEGSLVHKYQFKYFTDYLNRTYLNEIIEFGSVGTRFNSTVLGWPNYYHSFSTQSFAVDGKKDIFYFGNVIHEGQKDYIVTERKTTYYSNDKWKLYNGSSLIYEGTVGTGFEKIVLADTDGDGIDNIYIQNGISSDYNCNPYPCGTIQSTTQSSSNTSLLLDVPYDTCWEVCSTYEKQFIGYEFNPFTETMLRETNSDIFLPNSPNIISTLIADLNGDGKDNIIFLDGHKNIFEISGTIGGSIPNLNYPSDLRILDFDGDGRDEILVIKDNNSIIYQYNSITQQFITIYSSSTFPTKDHRIFIGDFNGDKKDDILAYKNGWSIRYSSGIGYVLSATTPSLRNYDPAGSLLDNNYYIGDFNADGFSDIAEVYKVSTTSRINIFYSKGEVFSSGFTNTFPQSNIHQDYFYPVDLNKDNKDELVYYNYSLIADYVQYARFNFGHAVPRITMINDGLNRKTKITYESIIYNTIYSLGESPSYFPLKTLMGNYYAVKEVSSSTDVYSAEGAEIESTESYTYEDLKYHSQGKGLLGFAKVKVNESESLGVYKSYMIDTLNYYYYLNRNYVGPSSDSINISTTYSLSTINYGQNIISPYIDTIVMEDFIKRERIVTSKSLDENGNVHLLDKNINDGEFVEVTAYNNYISKANYGIPNKPSSITTTKSYMNKDPVSLTISFDYYSHGLINHEILRPGTTKALTTTNEYNSKGNLTTTILSASGLTPRSTTFSYDSKNRYVTSVQEPDGKTSNYLYSGSTGNLVRRTGIDGLVTDYNYDGLGRLTMTRTPEGHDIYNYIIWNSQPEAYPGTYLLYNLVPGQPSQKIYCDKFGRALRTTWDGLQSQIYQDNEYNSNGTLSKSSWPYYQGENIRWTTYTYDEFERLSVVNNNSLISTYSYSENSVEFSDPTGKTKTTKFNGLSKPVQVIEDDNTTITYDYNSFGELSSLTTNGNTILCFNDEFGFQDSVYNAYTGGVKYSHNAFGELVSQKDAKGQEVQIQYDIMGRITYKTTPLGTTSYSYYTDGGGIRKVSAINAPGNVNETFNYDSYGRVNQYSKSIQNEMQMNYSLGYDAYGNNTSITYPSGLVIVNGYDSNGYLTEIKKSDDYSIWKLNSIKATGVPSASTLGYNTLNLTKQYHYDSYENITSIATGVWQQIYNIDDTTGNLLSRSYRNITNPATMVSESFLYDDLNRLTTAQVSGLQPQVVSYSAIGNILSKSGLGDYTYDQSKTNSLLSVENVGHIITEDPQHIYYNYLNKPDSISEGDFRYYLVYGADNQRVKSALKEGTVFNKTIYYGPGYEKIVTPDSTWENHYIVSPYGLEAIVTKKNNTERLYYAETDHLGSLIGLISSSGIYVERHSFDSWGRRRNPTDWSYNNVPIPFITDRGFTGHEHLDMFSLINMNGRMYDAVTARFLNVDPIVADPFNSQSFNSYGYCLNNPLKYVDPSGYSESDFDEEDIWNYYLKAWEAGYRGGYASFSRQFVNQYLEYLYLNGSVGGGAYSMTFTWDELEVVQIPYDPSDNIGYRSLPQYNVINQSSQVSLDIVRDPIEYFIATWNPSERAGGYSLDELVAGAGGANVIVNQAAEGIEGIKIITKGFGTALSLISIGEIAMNKPLHEMSWGDWARIAYNMLFMGADAVAPTSGIVLSLADTSGKFEYDYQQWDILEATGYWVYYDKWTRKWRKIKF